jgi:hypothetical protein
MIYGSSPFALGRHGNGLLSGDGAKTFEVEI